MLLAAGQAAWAQEVGDTSRRQLDQVVVTATKYPVKQSQTGKVVIVVTHEELEKAAGKPLGEVLSEQAGVSVAGALNDPGTNQSIFIRGAGSGRALILIDGIPLTDPTQTDNSFDINLIPVSMIERIEISKGAQSTLYGSDAIAGVVNIITIKSDIKKPFNGKASLSGGNYGTYNGNAQLYGKVAQKLTYNVRYNRDHSDGFATAADTSTTPNHTPFEHNGYRSDLAAGNLAWNPIEQLTVKGFLQYNHYTVDIDNGPFEDARDYTSASKELLAGGGFTYKLANTTINGNYLYSTSDRRLNRDSVFDQSYVNEHYFGKSQFAEIYASTRLGYGLTLLTGGDYRINSMNLNGVYGGYPETFKDTSVSQNSLYSSLLYTGDMGLSVELGGRLNTDSRFGSNYTYTFNPAWLIGRNWKLYASIASAWKAPTLYQLYSAYGDPALQPEKSTTYEGGLQFNDDRLNLRGTYFHRNVNDGIDFNNFTYLYYNYDNEKGDGIELEGKYKFNEYVSLSANYTWLHMKEKTQSHVSYDDTAYSYALRVPASTINFTLGLRPVPNLYVGITGHYESKRYDLGGYDPVTYNPLPDAVLDAFVIVNLYGEYRLCKWFKVFVDGRNVTDKHFTTVYGYNSIPAMWSGGATIEF
jgi:vitamin B12 transporter